MVHDRDKGRRRPFDVIEEATLLTRLREQQSELVSEVLARASRSEAFVQENTRLTTDLAGSIDRIQEVHHRVRNHLQALTGLLSAQQMAEQSESVRRALQETVARLSSIAAIHDLLARDPESGGIDLPALARRLGQDLLRQGAAEDRIELRTDVAPLRLAPREGTALVLIITELISNAIEHAFSTEGEGTISISVTDEGTKAVLEVKDDGRGLGEGFDPERQSGLGLGLVCRLATRDLGGEIEARDDGGACWRVTFPIPVSGARK